MADRGLLLYGIAETEAIRIRDSLSASLPDTIELLSATGHEKSIIRDFLENTPEQIFAIRNIRFLMFLGFEDTDIQSALAAFPKDVARPIFCTLTENNLSWTFEYLAEHLAEEHERMTSK
jgi:hypothetical protein